MKIIKISLDHYIIVDESKQPVQGYYYDNFIKDIRDTRGAEYGEADHCWQITHSTQLDKGMDNVTFISLSEVKELLGEVDVEKKSYAFIKKVEGSEEHRLTYIDGYRESLEDNKDRKYTKQDMVEWAMCMIAQYVQGNTNIWNRELLRQSLPQLRTEWDVEFVNGKLKLK